MTDACSNLTPPTQVFAKGAQRAANDYWSKFDSASACTGPATAVSGVFDLGAELPPASFPGGVVQGHGGTRIQETSTIADGAVVDHGFVVTDQQLGVRCNIVLAADGKRRCMPQGASSAIFYADSKCTQPLAEDADTCNPAKYLLARSGTGCDARIHAYAKGAAVDPKTATYFQDLHDGNGCSQVTFPGNTKTLYAPGAEIDPTTFAEATRVAR